MLSRNRPTGNVYRWSERFDNNISNHIKSSLFQHTTDVEDRGQKASKSWRGPRPRFTGSNKTTKDEHYLATTTNSIFTLITVKLRCLRQVPTLKKSKVIFAETSLATAAFPVERLLITSSLRCPLHLRDAWLSYEKSPVQSLCYENASRHLYFFSAKGIVIIDKL